MSVEWSLKCACFEVASSAQLPRPVLVLQNSHFHCIVGSSGAIRRSHSREPPGRILQASASCCVKMPRTNVSIWHSDDLHCHQRPALPDRALHFGLQVRSLRPTSPFPSSTAVPLPTNGPSSVQRDLTTPGVMRGVSTQIACSVAYRGVVPAETLEMAGVKTKLKTRPLCWVGPDRHIITYPIQGRRFINIVAFSTNSKVPIGSVDSPFPWVQPASKDELMSEFSGWGNDVNIMLKHIKNPNKWHIHFLYPPLPSYVRQRVVLVGDAAHAMLPHLGAGVGQGFEDVYALCTLLGHPRTSARNLDSALKAYDKIRVPGANAVLEMNVAAGDIFEERGKDGRSVTAMGRQLTGIWEPVWRHNLAKDIARAMAVIHDEKALL
ncbi:putative salicylate hydroxylase [Lyophyllum shimeji]|uniref:Salicylate hydroxylase n=1 Tax=Lyophyllum shimeji TaxID=47721 RepID=A0A9P3PV74_LYOSH|nr:putative salicylate hydroxylase [Lyophyllum shimeji]